MNDPTLRGGNLVWLDLCSGLGGASQPALDRGWKVIRVDIDPRFKPDIVADVRALPLKPFHVDVLWASFPCQDFSKWGMRHFYPEPPDPDLSIALAVKGIIDAFKPAMWVTENVWAARPFVSPIFGPVRAAVPGHVFWSNQILMLPNALPHKNKVGVGEKWHQTGKAAQAEAAKIPYEIGLAICKAVESRDE